MKFISTDFPGLFLIEPLIHGDSRGYFFESFRQDEFNAAVGEISFVQDNQSMSSRGVVRGLHFQRPPYAQAKLVRCLYGQVLDAAMDLRKGSPTYGRIFTAILSDENQRQMFIPQGFAHGFAVLSDKAVFAYKCDNYYHPEAEGTIAIFDDALNVDWGLKKSEMILSTKDAHADKFIDFDSPFIYE